MASNFLTTFAKENDLNSVEVDVLAQADVRSHEDVDSLLRAFPTIVEEGVRLPHVSNAAAMHLSAAYSTIASAIANAPSLCRVRR